MKPTAQVAKPKTIAEIISTPPESLMTLSLSELEEVHKTVSAGTTKPAKAKTDLIAGIIAGKRKEEKRTAKPEAVANSVKQPAAPKGAAAAATAAAAAPKSPVKPSAAAPAAPVKPAAPKGNVKPAAAAPAAPAAPTKPAAKPPQPAPKAAAAAKPSKPVEQMDQAELIAYAKELEAKAEKFPAVLDTPKSLFKRFEPETVQELGAMLIANPYHVFCFIDERIDDNLTQCLVVYASDKSVLAVDKNRQKETHMTIATDAVASRVWTIKDGGATLTFPLAFYVREPKE
jgi:hypothetical protein